MNEASAFLSALGTLAAAAFAFLGVYGLRHRLLQDAQLYTILKNEAITKNEKDIVESLRKSIYRRLSKANGKMSPIAKVAFVVATTYAILCFILAAYSIFSIDHFDLFTVGSLFGQCVFALALSKLIFTIK